ncbi:hypothetical protein DDZ13_15240 [Coraliomargarita sinensis]|uniref:Uncharacterized protein n=1 Tax=Coraliomargarita sinensis TaxID=2174842 RepID=A0A317ZCD5_9BACT|nr:hypothetical protein [Coraliomargarita sinensis]PXA02804.1 hypothetical protein DDZ13_15240 [Coraliomargarita sinensis]
MKLIFTILLIALVLIGIAHYAGITVLDDIEVKETVEVSDESKERTERVKELTEAIELEHPEMTKEEAEKAAVRMRLSEEVLARREVGVDPVDADNPVNPPENPKNQLDD